MMKSRRGISSVVGAVFAIIALSTVIGYITYSMDVLSNYNQSVLIRTQQMTDIANEKFQVSSVSFVNNKFSIAVNNTGSLPINFTKIWITNKTTSACNTYSCNINYVPNKVVVPGNGTILGQKMSGTIDTTKPYYVKIVTSRGNSQQFTVNSVSSAPLNIQFLSMPPTMNIGFKTQLVMIVTNNGSSTVTNVTPATLPNPPVVTGIASCTAGPVSPSTYNTLAPGQTAIFKWDITVNAGGDGQTCTYNLSPPLQNGYAGQSVSAVITVTTVKFTSTNLASDVGIVTMNYTTFRWTQGNQWNTGWNFTHGINTVIKVNMTNNNSTSPIYLSKYTHLFFTRAAGNNYRFFLVNTTTSLSPLTAQAYSCSGLNEYCKSIPASNTIVAYFASSTVGTANINSLGQSDQYAGAILLYGKFSNTQAGSGNQYGQTLPFIAVNSP